jgi:hypothetical protein
LPDRPPCGSGSAQARSPEQSGYEVAARVPPALIKSWEESRAEARAEGRQEGESAALLRLARQRFGDAVDPHIERRIATASIEQLDTWTSRVLSASTLAELLAD